MTSSQNDVGFLSIQGFTQLEQMRNNNSFEGFHVVLFCFAWKNSRLTYTAEVNLAQISRGCVTKYLTFESLVKMVYKYIHTISESSSG